MPDSSATQPANGQTLPLLVIVNGAPASGKTTLARRLADTLRLPLLERDGLKEVLADHLEVADLAQSQALTRAAVGVFYTLADELVRARVGMVLDQAYRRGQAEDQLRPLLAACRTVTTTLCRPTGGERPALHSPVRARRAPSGPFRRRAYCACALRDATHRLAQFGAAGVVGANAARGYPRRLQALIRGDRSVRQTECFLLTGVGGSAGGQPASAALPLSIARRWRGGRGVRSGG